LTSVTHVPLPDAVERLLAARWTVKRLAGGCVPRKHHPSESWSRWPRTGGDL